MGTSKLIKINFLKPLAVAFLFTALSQHQAFGQKLQRDTVGGYRLVWSDEFERKGAPDTSVWRFEHGFTRNHELQWYQSENATCKKGMLVIEARKVHLPNPNYVAGSNNWKTNREFIEYTSSSMLTHGRKEWLYGRFVMRAKIDVSPGMWPAFWALGLGKPWPSNGEIDIMEYYRNHVRANIACGTQAAYKAKWYSKALPLDSLGKSWSKSFHTWRMDWDEKEIALYLDDRLMNKVALAELVNRDGSGYNPFNHSQYILLDFALGGDNGGTPDDSTFPHLFQVDYVRVYQRQR